MYTIQRRLHPSPCCHALKQNRPPEPPRCVSSSETFNLVVWKKLISVKRPFRIEPTDTTQLSSVCVCVCARARCVRMWLCLLYYSVCLLLFASVRAYVCVCARDWKKKHWYGASQDSQITTSLWQFEWISVKRTVQLTTCIIYIDWDHSLYSGEVKQWWRVDQCILSSAHICICRVHACVCGVCARVCVRASVCVVGDWRDWNTNTLVWS